MERRELLKMIALMTGAAVVGGSALLQSCSSPIEQQTGAIGEFSSDDQLLLAEIADTILPATQTPGAKAAGVGPFMAMMVTDCYEPAAQKTFKQGLRELDSAIGKLHGSGFLKASPEQREQFLVKLDQEAKLHQQNKSAAEFQTHYFTMIKQLTLLGYFSSEIGCTQALRYQAIPGRYEGTVSYKKGDKAWA